MKIPARNTQTKTIMYWVGGEEARAALGQGRKLLVRSESSIRSYSGQINAAQRDLREINRLSAYAAAIEKSANYRRQAAEMDKDDCDIIGLPVAGQSIHAAEDVHSKIRRIEERWVDAGDGNLFGSPTEAIEYYERLQSDIPTGLAYMASVLCAWPSDQPIDDDPGYVLEDGRRFAEAAEADRADTQLRN